MEKAARLPLRGMRTDGALEGAVEVHHGLAYEPFLGRTLESPTGGDRTADPEPAAATDPRHHHGHQRTAEARRQAGDAALDPYPIPQHLDLDPSRVPEGAVGARVAVEVSEDDLAARQRPGERERSGGLLDVRGPQVVPQRVVRDRLPGPL